MHGSARLRAAKSAKGTQKRGQTSAAGRWPGRAGGEVAEAGMSDERRSAMRCEQWATQLTESAFSFCPTQSGPRRSVHTSSSMQAKERSSAVHPLSIRVESACCALLPSSILLRMALLLQLSLLPPRRSADHQRRGDTQHRDVQSTEQRLQLLSLTVRAAGRSHMHVSEMMEYTGARAK